MCIFICLFCGLLCPGPRKVLGCLQYVLFEIKTFPILVVPLPLSCCSCAWEARLSPNTWGCLCAGGEGPCGVPGAPARGPGTKLLRSFLDMNHYEVQRGGRRQLSPRWEECWWLSPGLPDCTRQHPAPLQASSLPLTLPLSGRPWDVAGSGCGTLQLEEPGRGCAAQEGSPRLHRNRPAERRQQAAAHAGEGAC